MLSTHSVLATDEQVARFAAIQSGEIDYRPIRTDVVISLTTVPTRLGTLKAVLHSLMQQSISGVPIELHIARGVRSTGATWPEMPGWLTNLRAVQVIEHDHDLGPAMKYLPALEAHRKHAVVVVDDDVLYPRDLVERLLQADMGWRGAAAVCMRGWRIHRELSWEQSVLTTPNAADDMHVGIVCGHGGYCVRAEQLNLDELGNLDRAPEDCWMMDDIWISAHLSRNRTYKRIVEGSVRYKIPIDPALGGDRERRNDNALRWFAGEWLPTDIETT